jgi:putative restriction endonuclease
MKYFIGNTDLKWYQYLKDLDPEDINFWQPSGKIRFRAIEQGAPFLLKLKNPINKIAGLGFFSSHSILPIDFAWETFLNRNGCHSKSDFYRMISLYREPSNPLDKNRNIGCIVLTDPIFFNEEDWIQVPGDWSKNIVQGKTYSTEEKIGRDFWQIVEQVLLKYYHIQQDNDINEDAPGYHYSLSKVRIGQGAFRVLITDAYSRRCAVSGEKTLPVLEAAHIKPYSPFGINAVNNGLLLRSDIHKLFDTGYVTVTEDYHIEISRRIREEFENGRDYYKYHGNKLISLPDKDLERPKAEFLRWHNENIFLSGLGQ